MHNYLAICKECCVDFHNKKHLDGWVDCEEIVDKENFKCEHCDNTMLHGSVIYVWEY